MANNTPIAGVSGISNRRMVFPDTVVNTYSDGFEVSADAQTQSTMQIATLVNCKTLSPDITGMSGISGPDADYLSNPFLGCFDYNHRGEAGSTFEFFA